MKIRPGENKQLEVSQLPAGAYTIKILNQKKSETYTFIKNQK
jgi:hypothetical protein